MLQYYLAGWHIKPKGVKKPYVSLPLSPYTADICGTRQSPLSGHHRQQPIWDTLT